VKNSVRFSLQKIFEMRQYIIFTIGFELKFNYAILPHLITLSWGLYLHDTFFADTPMMLTLYLLLLTVHQI
jgi:hypothetical protein